MIDTTSLFQIVLVIAAVVTPAIVLARLLGGSEEGSLASLFVYSDHDVWPRGVQEEDPKPWAFGADGSGRRLTDQRPTPRRPSTGSGAGFAHVLSPAD